MKHKPVTLGTLLYLFNQHVKAGHDCVYLNKSGKAIWITIIFDDRRHAELLQEKYPAAEFIYSGLYGGWKFNLFLPK